MKALLLLACCAGLALAGDAFDQAKFEQANKKIDLIEAHRVAPGSVILFTPAEVNAWVRGKAAESVSGVRETQLVLGMGTIKGSALVDLVQMQLGRGEPVNPLVASLVSGERPVQIAVRVESAVTKCTVFLDSVQYAGAELSGGILNLLYNAFFQPMYPDAKIDRPFPLHDPIERLTVQPDGLRVFIKK